MQGVPVFLRRRIIRPHKLMQTPLPIIPETGTKGIQPKTNLRSYGKAYIIGS